MFVVPETNDVKRLRYLSLMDATLGIDKTDEWQARLTRVVKPTLHEPRLRRRVTSASLQGVSRSPRTWGKRVV